MKKTNNNSKERKQNLTQFASLVNLAFIDDEFNKEEYELLEKLGDKLGITKDERLMVLDNPDAFTIEQIESYNKRLEFIFDFFKMIYADNKLDRAEYELVLKYIQAIGFNIINTKTILNRSIELFEKNDRVFLKGDMSLTEYKNLIFKEDKA
ncbi:hypothetical protein U6A24_10930 [Aquimarina gracilis]|uniref:Tellurite resistance protein TerB n=1 Tax=Aquimarina gracilis TaxID=874422 RepID=A0ABU5ZVU6_9FLAO|nr:hypothetical protein [Aquimarina gracilis]MEB3345978.1 hypothetical protein [Aquimarina gracilis]